MKWWFYVDQIIDWLFWNEILREMHLLIVK